MATGKEFFSMTIPMALAFKANLTAGDLAGLRISYREDRERNCQLFVDYRFEFRCDDGEEIKGIISKVLVSNMADGVEVEFLTPEKQEQPRCLFYDYLRESQGTPDFGRWFVCSGTGDQYVSKPGNLRLISKYSW